MVVLPGYNQVRDNKPVISQTAPKGAQGLNTPIRIDPKKQTVHGGQILQKMQVLGNPEEGGYQVLRHQDLPHGGGGAQLGLGRPVESWSRAGR